MRTIVAVLLCATFFARTHALPIEEDTKATLYLQKVGVFEVNGRKWQENLTYWITKYPATGKNRKEVDKELEKAFKTWSDAVPLTFEQPRQGLLNTHINIEIMKLGDGKAFNGVRNTPAQTDFPQFGGDSHFDDEKNEIINKRRGSREVETPVEEEKPPGPPPDLCQDSSIDTITQNHFGNTYVFKGDYYWKIVHDKIAYGFPRKISEDWGGLEGNLDASLSWSNGKTYFFKDDRYWRFTERKMDNGYPKLLNEGFEGIPYRVDCAFKWSGDGKTYFFKGDKYWMYDTNNQPVSDDYPKPISNWKGLPNNIDAALQFDNNKTYFFSGDKYYRFDDATHKVEVFRDHPPYPRSNAKWWFGCPSG